MRVFVAGSTGAIGRFLLPELVENGYEVEALVRSAEKRKQVEAVGARAIVADALNAAQLTAAVRDAQPDVIIDQLTALAGAGDLRHFDREAAATNRLRTEGTDTMLAAARLAGTRRFIAQSFCGWPYAREGGPTKTEADPLDSNPPAGFSQTLSAIKYLENAVRQATDLEGVVLRYGVFYGPGTAISQDGQIGELIRKRLLPIVGDGAGIWSFIHIRDAARATVAAVSRGAPGIYNVVDDEPAPVSAWLPVLAHAVGAKPPRRVPAWLGKLAVGEGGVSMMTKIRGCSNAKARRELGWRPVYSSWRRGFVEGLKD
ncbi:MAG TPA: NAD(P)-dependent oxidoreductase [Gemmatimonadales bacterium]|nr:NAD(P)-dependent oxidoreductase [Gemmatimonadales bacterium]